MQSFDKLPIIDISGLRAGDRAAAQRVGQEIERACREVGFFYIVGHGIAQTVIDRALENALAFFRQPAEEKRKVAANKTHRGFHALGDALMYGASKPDYKEFFQIGLDLGADDPDVQAGQPLRGANLWPATPEAFRPAMEAYFQAVGQCGADLLRGVALSLGLAEDFFQAKYAKPLQRTQAVYYPPQDPAAGDDQFGVAPHTDFGCITLLYQDGTGGLEVQNLAGEWVQAPPIAGSFVINVGDLLERWSNDRFKSDSHRVVNRSGKERISIATFYDPTYGAVIDPRDLGLRAGEEAHYPPVAAGDHILGRIDKSFGYRKSLAGTPN